ncbi:WhiB family transcriptional regulator [Curtobacterium sp. MCSS17_016]|uniref:WhiB family transcriptional regulator n=1 Tax=Curtobacterium sp. MCSS17_016 TaxID=2175644 RepID=UPI000DA7BDDB|nr:WhiB family transcriptional regulator [Curtobacterium sp. MCSS17_016]WIE81064.1 WhiB family transcriptional regulator [Curtobacterium sp. MCSS17_016]
MSATRLAAPDWRDQAECRFDPDTWFDKRSETFAKEICDTVCRVQEQCLVYALAHGEDFGIRAGLTPSELKALPGFVRAGTTSEYVPESDERHLARFSSAARNRKTPDPLADLDHPADRKTPEQ